MRGVYIVSLIGYWYTSTAHLCPVPVTYRLGEVDERFPITREEILPVLTAAEAMWEVPLEQDLFIYDDTSSFVVNFIFDERQQLAATQEQWEQVLDAAQAEYETVLEAVKRIALRYETESASYTTKREIYESALGSYNQKVERYNAKGGVPEAELPDLEAEAASLQKQQRELISAEKDLKDLSEEVNKLGEEGNEMIKAYNAEVVKYNELYGTLDTFTQGDFERSRINIYKFTDTEELTEVIAHEFGHALGIGHVEGEESVMYYLMTERDFPSLSATDQKAFLDTCGEQESWSGLVRQFIRTTLQIIN
jgi:Matrixin